MKIDKETKWSLGGTLKAAFFKTSQDRQKRVIEAALEEFSRHSFREASLNDIIKRANISKGGMFKYIEDKAELYLYIIELALIKLADYQRPLISADPCYIKRQFNLFIESKGFYEKYPLYYQLIVKVSLDMNSPCYDQFILMRYNILRDHNNLLISDIDWEQYYYTREKVEAYLETVMKGIDIKLLQVLTGDPERQLNELIQEIKSIRAITIRALKKER